MRKLRLGMALILAAGAGLLSCSAGKLLLVNTLARSGDYREQADLAYGTDSRDSDSRDSDSRGSDPRQRLDLYLPARGIVPKPLMLVFIPGGCWGACDTLPKEDYRFIADTFTGQGYVVAIINYRLFPDHLFPTIIGDAALAVDFLAAQGASLGAPGGGMVLMGHSAGAHLTALLALDDRYLKPETRAQVRGWVGFAGPYDFLPFTKDYQPALFAPEERFSDSQPVNFVSSDDTPALLLYGNDDAEVKPRNILSLTRHLMEQGVPVQAHCYDGIDHTGIIGTLSRPLRDRRPVLGDVLTFLQQLEQGRVEADASLTRCQALSERAPSA